MAMSQSEDSLFLIGEDSPSENDSDINFPGPPEKKAKYSGAYKYETRFRKI